MATLAIKRLVKIAQRRNIHLQRRDWSLAKHPDLTQNPQAPPEHVARQQKALARAVQPHRTQRRPPQPQW